MSVRTLLNEYLAPVSDDARDDLAALLGSLRALGMVHQFAHWKCKGASFYGDHLLFERMYGDFDDLIDVLAEKIVGFFGPKALSIDVHTQRVADRSEQWVSGHDVAQAALRATLEVTDEAERLYDWLDEQEELSLGLDDYLQALLSKLEEHTYLLRQRLRSA